jgi:hypothetical protein
MPDGGDGDGGDAGMDAGADPDSGADAATMDGDAASDGGPGPGDGDGDGDGSDGGSDEDAGAIEPPPPTDACPDDPLKLEPGSCGCGASEDDAADCEALSSALRHRYRFDGGAGTTVPDSVSGADATLVNTTLSGTALTLAGGTSDEYLELPAGTLSALTDATVEVWLEWQGSNDWERIFDFGGSSNGAGAQGNGTSYIFLTPQSSAGTLRAAFTLDGFDNEKMVEAASALGAGMHHVALVFDDQAEMRLYLDGVLQDSAALTTGDSLSGIADVNNWIGRSQYQTDAELAGTIHELRIHGAALSDAQVGASYGFGPDPAFLP